MELDRSRLLGFRICDPQQADERGAPAPTGSKVGKLDKRHGAGVRAPMRSKIGAKS